jgi:hypothetical protein
LSPQFVPSEYIRTRTFWSTDRVQNFLASDLRDPRHSWAFHGVPGHDAAAEGAENWPTVAPLVRGTSAFQGTPVSRGAGIG